MGWAAGAERAPNLIIPGSFFGLHPDATPEENHAAFLTAIASNRTIQLLDGVYRVSGQLVIDTDLIAFSLRGMGMHRTTIQFEQGAAGNGFVFGVTDKTYTGLEFSDMHITSAAVLPSYGGSYGLVAPGVASCTIVDFQINRCKFSCPENSSNGIKGVYMDGSVLRDFIVDSCEFDAISRAAIELWPQTATAYSVDGVVVKNSRFTNIGVKVSNVAVAESLGISIVTNAGKIEIANNYFKDVKVDAGGLNGTAIECSGDVSVHDNRFDQSGTKFSSILISVNNRAVRLADNRDIGIATFGGFEWKVFNAVGPVIIRGNRIRGTLSIRGGKNILLAENEMDTVSVGAGTGSAPCTNLYLDRNYIGLDTSRSAVINCSVAGCVGWRITGNTIKHTGANIIDNPSNVTALLSTNIINDVVVP